MSSVVSTRGERTVAVVVPCYGEPVSRVLSTLTSAAAVPEVNLIVLVDDGTPDDPYIAGIPDRIGRARTVVLRLPENRGPAAAMNVGVGFLPDDALVARLDVGDAFNRFAKRDQLREHLYGLLPRATFSPHFDLVEERVFRPPTSWARRIYKDGAFCICTCVFDRAVWAEVDGFDESLRYGDDWDFAMRVQHRVGWTMFDAVTCEAGAFDGGHTKRADQQPELSARKAADTARVLERGWALSHPTHARATRAKAAR